MRGQIGWGQAFAFKLGGSQATNRIYSFYLLYSLDLPNSTTEPRGEESGGQGIERATFSKNLDSLGLNQKQTFMSVYSFQIIRR